MGDRELGTLEIIAQVNVDGKGEGEYIRVMEEHGH